MVKVSPTDQKLRGGYYTPKLIADFLASWSIRSTSDKILEPSCGDGELLVASAKRLMEMGATPKRVSKLLEGVEFDFTEANQARKRLQDLGIPKSLIQIHSGDFFTFYREIYQKQMFLDSVISSGKMFDVVIGNPPFIRYQTFPEKHRETAFEIMNRLGFHPNRLTNAWVPFLITSVFLLNAHGRMAMIIPAELFQVNYAAESRKFLSTFFSRLTIITFKNLVFDGIQQEVILLLAEKNGNENVGINVVELDGIEDLATYEYQHLFTAENLKPMDHSTEKWTQYYLDTSEIELLRSLKLNPSLTVLGDVMSVDVGVVTGQNDFFLLTEKEVDSYSLSEYVSKIVSRSAHLVGAMFTNEDWVMNCNSQYHTYLLRIPKVPINELPMSVQKYIQEGESKGYQTGFKCRNRSPWYYVPSVWTPDGFMLRQVHGYPKIILNYTDATCTDTIHRIRFHNDKQKDVITAAFINSLTLAFSEVTGRGYGGGVLTFEPSEAEKLPLPLIHADMLDLSSLNKLLRQEGIESVLNVTDNILLREGLGLADEQIAILHGIWHKLRDRRINRK